VVPAATDAWRHLTALGHSHHELGRWLGAFSDAQAKTLEAACRQLLGEHKGGDTDVWLVDQVKEHVEEHIHVLMLFPEMRLLTYLLDGIETAAGNGELLPGEQSLKDQLVALRDELGRRDLAQVDSWRFIGRNFEAMRSNTPQDQADGQSRVVPFNSPRRS
jgi:hypothetical protein